MTAFAPHIFTAKDILSANAAAGVSSWSWNVDSDLITMDELGYDTWGVPKDQQPTFATLSKRIHPEDLTRVSEDFHSSRSLPGPYETDFRILFEREIRWIAARGQGNDLNIVDRLMFGVFIDVTERKQAEEVNELLASEMSHRVKNLLMIASALAESVGRSVETKEELVRDLTSRLVALGRAHELVHRVPGPEDKAALLGDLLAVLLSPYDDHRPTDNRGRIHISVPKIGVGPKAATALAMVFHELATNSLKYGALSSPTGAIDVSSMPYVGEEIVITWTEQGSPVTPPPSKTGFGSEMLHQSMANGLGGSIQFTWLNPGVAITLRMKEGRLAA